jgi:hypothetical protein
MPMPDSPGAEFLVDCETVFRFLKDAHNFTGPEVTTSPNVMIVSFQKGQIAVECIFDQRDDDVSVKLVRLSHGRKPDAYRKDERGHIVREYLHQLLLRRGLRDFKFERPSRGRSEHQRILEGYARLLQLYGSDVLNGSARIFDT